MPLGSLGTPGKGTTLAKVSAFPLQFLFYIAVGACLVFGTTEGLL